jgi:hypothetical protein
LALKLDFGGGAATGSVVIARRPASFVVRDANIMLSAALIAEGIDSLRGLQPTGVLSFRTQGLALKPRGIAGDAEFTWQGAAAAAASLGDYRAVVHATDGGAASVELATLKGPLHVAARGNLGPEGGLRLRGTVMPEAEHRARLWPLIALLGPDRGDGAIAFDIALPIGGAA